MVSREHFVNTDPDVRLFSAVRRGSAQGPAVLLLHGLGIGWRYWDLPSDDYSTMDFLATAGLQAYAIDHRGYGRSTPVDGFEVNALNAARDVGALLDFIRHDAGVDVVHLVGHSWGGIVAVMAAAQYGSSVASAVLMGTPYRTLHDSFRREIADIDGDDARATNGWLPNYTYDGMEEFLHSFDLGVMEAYRSLVASEYPSIPVGIVQDVKALPHAEFVSDVACPTLIITGTHDDVVERSDALSLLDDLQATQKDLLLVGNCGHLPALERLAHRWVDRVLLSWIESLHPKGGTTESAKAEPSKPGHTPSTGL